MIPKTTTAALALALALLWACDDGGGATLDAVTDATTEDSTAADTSAADTAAPYEVPDDFDLSGRWALLMVQGSVAELPFIGETAGDTRTFALVDIAADGAGAFAMTQTVCDVVLDSGTDMVSTILPDAAIAAIPPTTRGVTLEGAAFDAARAVDVWGAALTDPEGEALPTDAQDPRVLDHEGDGKPGMTVRVTGAVDGEIYVVQRGWTALAGRVTGPDRVDGGLEWGQEQIVLDADNDLLKSPIPATPDLDASWFRATRVAAEYACEDVIAGQEALFAR